MHCVPDTFPHEWMRLSSAISKWWSSSRPPVCWILPCKNFPLDSSLLAQQLFRLVLLFVLVWVLGCVPSSFSWPGLQFCACHAASLDRVMTSFLLSNGARRKVWRSPLHPHLCLQRSCCRATYRSSRSSVECKWTTLHTIYVCRCTSPNAGESWCLPIVFGTGKWIGSWNGGHRQCACENSTIPISSILFGY